MNKIIFMKNVATYLNNYFDNTLKTLWESSDCIFFGYYREKNSGIFKIFAVQLFFKKLYHRILIKNGIFSHNKGHSVNFSSIKQKINSNIDIFGWMVLLIMEF